MEFGLPLVGSLALHGAFVVCAIALVAGVIGGRTGKKHYRDVATYATWAIFGLVAISALVYVNAFITHDFALKNVQRYSDVSMPLPYLIAAFWGGQAGSLLYWVTVLSSLTALALWIHRKKEAVLIPWFCATSALLLGALIFILLYAPGSDPFATFHVLDTPKDGQGLNPLLQTPLMVIHPPNQLAGFASLGVPFAFTAAALMSGRLGGDWLRVTRIWALVSFLFLSIGNILGGMWAYEELGWGGYWAWDPVENAAFMPWLAVTAFLHSIMVQERRGMLKRWNVVLITVAFLLSVFGTYITRSGLIESVHTFAQSSIGDYFAVLLLASIALTTALVVWRWKSLKSEANFDSVLSREAAFLGNNWILLGIVFVILWGTMFPKLKEMITGDKISFGPPWYNQYIVPLAVVLMLIVAVGTLLPWKRVRFKHFRRNFLIPIVGTLVLTPALCAGYWFLRAGRLDIDLVPLDVGYAIGMFSMCVFVFMTIVLEFWRGVAARMRNGENPVAALLGLFERQRRRYGGYIVHLGLLLIMVAFCGNAFKVEQDVQMEIGDIVPLGDYEVRYDGIQEDDNANRWLVEAKLTVLKNGEEYAQLRPGRATFHKFENSPTSELAIDSRPNEDLYVAIAGFSSGGKLASFKMVIFPLTWWFWFGGAVIVFGTIICLWPRSTKVPQRVYRRAAATAAALLLVGSACFAPLLFVESVAMAAGESEHHEHAEGGAKAQVGQPQVYSARMRNLMARIRVNCEASSRPTMANSDLDCPDYLRDRQILERLVSEGKTDEEIFAWFVADRGAWCIATPGNEDGNFLGWLLPLLAMAIAAPLILMKIRGWTRTTARQAATVGGAPLPNDDDDDEDAEYQALLERELENT